MMHGLHLVGDKHVKNHDCTSKDTPDMLRYGPAGCYVIEFSLKTAPPPGDGVVQGESCRSGYIIPLLYRSIYTMPLLWECWMVHGSCLTGVEQHAMSQCFTPNHIPYMLSCHHGFLNELDISTR